MKSLYYRPEKLSLLSLALLGIAAAAIGTLVEWTPESRAASQRELMLAAARRAEAGFEAIRRHRAEAGHRTLSSIDPADTGLLGPSMSMVTSLPGHLDAKQTSANPNFAAVVVHYLVEAGASPGDRVAIGCTGSFPALNIAVLAAVESMGLQPTLVSSASSSQYGANDPRLMWPDMERVLNDERILSTRSAAISRGGFRDMAAGMSDQTRQLLETAIARGCRPMLEVDDLEDSIEQRMGLFAGTQVGVNHVAAYINVGGGSASVGGTRGNDQLGRGLISPSDYRSINDPIDSVATRFLAADIPVINMIEVVAMAREHGLPVAPTARPSVGESGVYAAEKPRRPLAFAGILLILSMTTVVVRPPQWIYRLNWKRNRQSPPASEPRWMV